MWMAGSLLYLWAVSVKTAERSLMAWIVETRRCCGMEVLRARVQFSAAAMTKSYGVTDGFVRSLCLKKCGTRDWSSPDCRRPEFLTSIVSGGFAEDKCISAVLSIGATFVRFVVYKCLHPNRNKWMLVVVMTAIDMCIGR
jgi:hypothetical protein